MSERPALVQLSDEDRATALERFHLLQPHLEAGVPLPRLAHAHGIALRTAERWVAQYRRHGLAGLVRKARQDHGAHRFPSELIELIEGLALRRPPPSIASVHRRVVAVAQERNWPIPSYSVIYTVIRALDPGRDPRP